MQPVPHKMPETGLRCRVRNDFASLLGIIHDCDLAGLIGCLALSADRAMP